VLPFIGPEYVAALLESPAKKPDSALLNRPSKGHEGIAISPSRLAFWARQMEALKAITIPGRLFPTRKGGAGSHSPSRRRLLPGEMGLIKFTAFMRRRPGLTHEQFVAHHREVHAPLFAGLPATRKYVRRYVQSHPIASQVPGFPASTFDGITEIWFDDLTGFHALFRDAEYLQTIRADEESFIDTRNSEMLLTVENPVIHLL
jgi:uncharacterized protein (TIGR02118 family)